MVLRKLRRGLCVLVPIYVCLVFIGFFSFIWSRARIPRGRKSIAHVTVYNEPISLVNTSFNSSKMSGVLNLHIWNDLCGNSVELLRETPLFPRYPHERLFIRSFQTARHVDAYAQRIFGFIEPKVSGLYTFAVSSDDTSELWLSFNENPRNLRLIASVFSPVESAWTEESIFSKYATQQSRNIRLEANRRYYVEALHKQGSGNGRIQVNWRKPGSIKLEPVTGEYLSAYFDDSRRNGSFRDLVKGHDELQWFPSHVKQRVFKGLNLKSQFNYTSFPLINRSEVKGVLNPCSYKPSYIIERNLSRYEGVNLVHDSLIFPFDNTYLHQARVPWSAGNKEVDNVTVSKIVGKFMNSLHKFHR